MVPPIIGNVASIRIEEIQHYQAIPDYREATHYNMPIIVRAPSSVWCIDGWQFIERSRRDGEADILCAILAVNTDDSIELAIQKTAIRTAPTSGSSRYGETVRNVMHLMTLLIGESGRLFMTRQGGDRRSEAFNGNHEDNVRVQLSKRLQRTVKTVNRYLSYGEYLDETALDFLIEHEAHRDFFESAQRVKRRVINELKQAGSTDEAIKAEISSHVELWYRQYEVDRRVGPAASADEGTQAGDAIQSADGPAQKDISPTPHASQPVEHEHWTGNNAPAESDYDEDTHRQRLADIGRWLINIPPRPLIESLDGLNACFTELADIKMAVEMNASVEQEAVA